MLAAANNLELEKAALLRDQLRELKRALAGAAPLPTPKAEAARPLTYPKTRRPSAGRAARRNVPF